MSKITMMHPEKHVRKILKIGNGEIDVEYGADWKSWLPKDANDAFLVCVGAGPWKEARRKNVQDAALAWFKDKYKDLSAISLAYVQSSPPFPLDWQNQMVHDLVKNLKHKNATFSQLCKSWSESNDWPKSIVDFFEIIGYESKGTKVLWLFVRDYLELPAFPVDRHVKSFLERLELPVNPWYITRLCLDVGVNPSALNRYIFFSKSTNIGFNDEKSDGDKAE